MAGDVNPNLATLNTFLQNPSVFIISFKSPVRKKGDPIIDNPAPRTPTPAVAKKFELFLD